MSVFFSFLYWTHCLYHPPARPPVTITPSVIPIPRISVRVCVHLFPCLCCRIIQICVSVHLKSSILQCCLPYDHTHHPSLTHSLTALIPTPNVRQSLTQHLNPCLSSLVSLSCYCYFYCVCVCSVIFTLQSQHLFFSFFCHLNNYVTVHSLAKAIHLMLLSVSHLFTTVLLTNTSTILLKVYLYGRTINFAYRVYHCYLQMYLH